MKKNIIKSSNVIISTDLETDDLMALWMLSKEIPYSNIIFLVGEGNALIKKIRMEYYAEILGFKNFKVVRGYSSDKNFIYDGYDVLTKYTILRSFYLIYYFIMNWLIKILGCEDISVKEIKKFIIDKTPLIISLKPPRELIDIYITNPDIFNECILYGYMSFNLRCLMKKNSKTLIVNFLESFKECYYYETYHAIGSNNIIGNNDIDMEKLPKVVYEVMMYWNKGLLKSCKSVCKEYKNYNDKKKQIKIL
jgi:hypothetical protein